MARTSSKADKGPPLLTGSVRAYKDNVAGQIVIETTKFNHAGSGLEICRLELGRAAEARMIVAIGDIMRNAERFAGWGDKLEGADPEAVLIWDPSIELDIKVGDALRLAAAYARALPPDLVLPAGARLRKGAKPKPPR
jgi:hypothetical protein